MVSLCRSLWGYVIVVIKIVTTSLDGSFSAASKPIFGENIFILEDFPSPTRFAHFCTALTFRNSATFVKTYCCSLFFVYTLLSQFFAPISMAIYRHFTNDFSKAVFVFFEKNIIRKIIIISLKTSRAYYYLVFLRLDS